MTCYVFTCTRPYQPPHICFCLFRICMSISTKHNGFSRNACVISDGTHSTQTFTSMKESTCSFDSAYSALSTAKVTASVVSAETRVMSLSTAIPHISTATSTLATTTAPAARNSPVWNSHMSLGADDHPSLMSTVCPVSGVLSTSTRVSGPATSRCTLEMSLASSSSSCTAMHVSFARPRRLGISSGATPDRARCGPLAPPLPGTTTSTANAATSMMTTSNSSAETGATTTSTSFGAFMTQNVLRYVNSTTASGNASTVCLLPPPSFYHDSLGKTLLLQQQQTTLISLRSRRRRHLNGSFTSASSNTSNTCTASTSSVFAAPTTAAVTAARVAAINAAIGGTNSRRNSIGSINDSTDNNSSDNGDGSDANNSDSESESDCGSRRRRADRRVGRPRLSRKPTLTDAAAVVANNVSAPTGGFMFRDLTPTPTRSRTRARANNAQNSAIETTMTSTSTATANNDELLFARRRSLRSASTAALVAAAVAATNAAAAAANAVNMTPNSGAGGFSGGARARSRTPPHPHRGAAHSTHPANVPYSPLCPQLMVHQQQQQQQTGGFIAPLTPSSSLKTPSGRRGRARAYAASAVAQAAVTVSRALNDNAVTPGEYCDTPIANASGVAANTSSCVLYPSSASSFLSPASAPGPTFSVSRANSSASAATPAAVRNGPVVSGDARAMCSPSALVLTVSQANVPANASADSAKNTFTPTQQLTTTTAIAASNGIQSSHSNIEFIAKRTRSSAPARRSLEPIAELSLPTLPAATLPAARPATTMTTNNTSGVSVATAVPVGTPSSRLTRNQRWLLGMNTEARPSLSAENANDGHNNASIPGVTNCMPLNSVIMIGGNGSTPSKGAAMKRQGFLHGGNPFQDLTECFNKSLPTANSAAHASTRGSLMITTTSNSSRLGAGVGRGVRLSDMMTLSPQSMACTDSDENANSNNSEHAAIDIDNCECDRSHAHGHNMSGSTVVQSIVMQ
mgnify:CR=1 FL=1